LEVMGLGTTWRSSASRRSLQARILYLVPDRWLSVCYRVSDHLRPLSVTLLLFVITLIPLYEFLVFDKNLYCHANLRLYILLGIYTKMKIIHNLSSVTQSL
jgi:hypothetical protein